MKKVNSKKKLAHRMRRLVAEISLSGLLGIVILIIGISHITSVYWTIENENYKNKEYISDFEQDLYQHQTILFEHISASSEDKKKSLETRAEQLKENIYDVLQKIGDSLKDNPKYSEYYHKIYSDTGGYMENVSIAIELSEKNQIETANYYMQNVLEDYIQTVNENVEAMDEQIDANLDHEREILNRDTKILGVLSYLLLLFILVRSVSTHITCAHIANQLVEVDAVTGIANLDRFLDEVDKKRKKGVADQYSLLSLNIKGYQFLVNQVGTENSDTILIQYAEKLSKYIKKNELLARVNGDRFVALKEKNDIDEFLHHAKRFVLEIPMTKGAKSVQVNSRCGVYEIADNETSADEMIRYATLAEKMARRSDANDLAWYTNEMTQRDMREKYIIANFSNALMEGEFHVYYQPKVNMKTGLLCGAEALVRWQHKGKMISPMEFIPVLEEEGRIVELDYYVLERVCRDLADWIAKGIQPVRVSSNFSKIHLRNAAFAERVLQIVHKHDVDTKYIETELTESSGYEDFEAMTHFVKVMNQAGVTTAIDDFGTGYSSLSMLKDTTVDVVKLDRSFLQSVKDGKVSNQTNEKMVENIVRMILDLDRQVICEGVETKEQVDFLQKIQCYVAQGFYYDMPLPHDEFEENWLKRNKEYAK